jgi:hypothetical protein
MDDSPSESSATIIGEIPEIEDWEDNPMAVVGESHQHIRRQGSVVSLAIENLARQVQDYRLRRPGSVACVAGNAVEDQGFQQFLFPFLLSIEKKIAQLLVSFTLLLSLFSKCAKENESNFTLVISIFSTQLLSFFLSKNVRQRIA